MSNVNNMHQTINFVKFTLKNPSVLVKPLPVRSGPKRGTERIVIDGNSGKSWFTDDHYYNFTPLN